MASKLVPFNINLLVLKPENTKFLNSITALDIFTGATKNFHPNGLFSTEIFGKYGEERRNRTFSYVDIKVPIFHPIVYKALIDTKELYSSIMSGKEYAIWNKDINDFEKSTPVDGDTGYNFFVKHFPDIKFELNNSSKREYNIKLINKFKDNCLLDKIIVMPAGLRDFEIDENGKPTEDEINTYYRKFLSYSNLITQSTLKVNPEAIDTLRYNLQSNFNEVYNHIKNLLDGKKKLILGSWASRKIVNATRNVITSSIDPVYNLNGDMTIGSNYTVIGMFQYIKATLQVSMFQIKNGFISKVFNNANGGAKLVNQKTLKSELIDINSDYFDDWMSDEGLEKTINHFAEEDLRHDPVMINKHYLGLIYKDKDTFKLLQDIDDLPENFDKSLVSPITFAELLYISVYKDSHKYPLLFTRYPITGYGSIYPSYPYLKSTVVSEIKFELDDNWEKSEFKAKHFPIRGEQFVNSMSPNSTHIGRLGADYDGDACTATIAVTDESLKEVNDLLNSSAYYIDSSGKLNFSTNDDIINNVLMNIR